MKKEGGGKKVQAEKAPKAKGRGMRIFGVFRSW